MVGGVGSVREVDQAEAAMVETIKPYVEKYKKVTYEAFVPVEVKTQVVRYDTPLLLCMLHVAQHSFSDEHNASIQVVAGTNYFVKVQTSVDGTEGCLILKIFQPLPHTGEPVQLSGVQGVSVANMCEGYTSLMTV
jgi:hypothetical protein